MLELTRRTLALAGLAAATPAWAQDDLQSVASGNGINLKYAEGGLGAPVLFVHGSLSDYSYWSGQMTPFGQRFRPIALSRRYNWPNEGNPVRPNYSAIADANDLAGFIETLNLAPCHLVGHSYGAYASLILAAARPDLVHTLTLAEPPVVPLLAHLEGPNAEKAEAAFEDIRTRMIAPMAKAFKRGNREEGVRTFVDYVFDRTDAWDSLSESAKAETMRNVHEWEVMLTTGVLFPDVNVDAIRTLKPPTLLMSGAQSYPFLALVDEALLQLLPSPRRLVVDGAGHQMWLQKPDLCRKAVFDLIASAKT
jgi:pimeloyl-ACP methyl ester carboxylesterase